MKKTIAVWFSCGAASAVAAKMTIEKYGKTHHVMIVNTPIDEEHPDNRRFLKDVETWLGQQIIIATNTDAGTSSCVDIWEKRRYMAGIKGAPCTQILKKGARYEFEKVHKIDFHVLGFTADETDRHERFIKYERDNVMPILIDEGYTKGKCFDILDEAGIKMPEIYNFGFPNANCIGCVKSNSPTYWNLVREHFPDVYSSREKQSREIGARLVKHKGKRLFLDELNPTMTGGKIKSWECGIFCDSK